MLKYERLFYLLSILGLVVLMSTEFTSFTGHYEYLESQLSYIQTHCKN